MTGWNEIAGRGFTPHGFAACIDSIPSTGWLPESVTLHNTASAVLERDRLRNMENFRKNRAHRPTGFRAFVTDDLIWILNVPSSAAASGDVEIMGDFDTEPSATRIRENAVAALVALYAQAGLCASDIRLAKDEPKTVRIPVHEPAGPKLAPFADKRPMVASCSA